MARYRWRSPDRRAFTSPDRASPSSRPICASAADGWLSAARSPRRAATCSSSWRALPLSLIDAFAPGTNLDGTLQAKLRVQGSMDAPLIDGTYNVAGLRLRRPEAALVPPLNVQGSGSLMGRQASIDARLAAAATNLTLKGKATLPRGAAPLSGSAAIGGTMDLAPFAPLLGNDIRNVTGRLRPGPDGRDRRFARDRQRQHRLLQRRRGACPSRGCG